LPGKWQKRAEQTETGFRRTVTNLASTSAGNLGVVSRSDVDEVAGGTIARHRFHVSRYLAVLAAGFAVGIALMHAALLPGGHWTVDEYSDFEYYRRGGLTWLAMRLLTWSPRPVSELMLYGYWRSVEATGSPLIVPFLGVLWCLLVIGTVLPARPTLTPPGLYRLVIAVCVLSMFLLGHQIDDIFYIPWYAAPYLPTLAGLTGAVMTLVFADAITKRQRWQCCAWLCLATASAETGMFAALGFGGVLLLLGGMAWLRRGPPEPAAWYLVPLALALVIMSAALVTRVTFSPGIVSTDTYSHHFGPSLIAAVRDLPARLAGVGGVGQDLALAPGLAMRSLLLAGFTLLCRAAMPAPIPLRYAAALLGGLLATVLLTSLAAYYQYGFAGFWRHDAFQQCMSILMFLVIGRLLGSFAVAPRRLSAGLGSISLILAMAVGMTWRLPALINDYRALPATHIAAARTLASGKNPLSDTMQFFLPPDQRVLQTHMSPGHYEEPPVPGAEVSIMASAVLRYFGKTAVDVIPWSAEPAAAETPVRQQVRP
jgi:hypothetical protein